MAWFKEKAEPTLFEKFCYKTISAGHVPQHVAFIMDGNRRYAKKHGIASSGNPAGHSEGFDKLTEVLSWCFQLGMPEVTVYAFSIENFKRSKEEVDSLMNLGKEKFTRLMEERELIAKYGVCIRVIGDLTLLPLDIQVSIAEAVDFSKDHKNHTLNIAIAYTSRNEIANAVKEVCSGVEDGFLEMSDITPRLLEKCLYTNKCRDVDLLIRTSGEVRLSDFLLWQTSFSMLSFIDPLWPEFSLVNFLYIIVKYQLGFNKLQATKDLSRWQQERRQLEQDFQTAHNNLIARLSQDGRGNGTSKVDKEELETELRRCTDERRDRIERFLNRLECKRNEYILNLLKKKHK